MAVVSAIVSGCIERGLMSSPGPLIPACMRPQVLEAIKQLNNYRFCSYNE